MPIKSLFDAKGPHHENADKDELVVDVEIYRKGIQNFAPGEGGAITKPIAVFEGSVVSVTGTLPGVNASTVGMEIQVINADVTADINISASAGNLIDSDTLQFTVSEEAAKFIAVFSSLDGYGWIVVTNKA